MTLPTQPITLSPGQIEDLNRQLSTLRHDINNNLSLIMAALELIRAKPDTLERMIAMATDQPTKISEAMKKFSAQFENALAITR